MRHNRLVLPIIAGLAALTAAADTGPFTLANGYIRLAGERASLTDLRFDAAGKARFGANILREGGFPDLAALPECAWTKTDSEVLITGLEARQSGSFEIPNGGQPELLTKGHTFGQTFTVAGVSFDSASALTPTWAKTDSGALLRLRREGPDGEVIASRRLENVPDNSAQALTFPLQPPGKYYLELSEPSGMIGWWGSPKDVYPGGEAYTDGRAIPERERAFTLRTVKALGKAQVRLTLDGPQLRITAELPGVAGAPVLPLNLRVIWDNTGYDCSAKAVPFSRFYTDNQRYLPAEQFKRAADPGLSFGPCSWVEATGTRGYDVRFAGSQLGLSWEMKPDTATFRLTTRARTTTDALIASDTTLAVHPHTDSVPADWPAFETPDPALTRDLNRFHYERNFSYPAPCGPAAWLEFEGISRTWFAGPLHQGEVAGITGTIVDKEGYVYTWGGSPGWPFPDNKVFDTRHFDTNARFILGCWRHACWSRDEAFLRAQADRIRRVMNYQLTTMHGADGVAIAASKDVTGRHKGCGDNYWDILPFGHKDAYMNALYYGSIEAMAELEEMFAKAGITAAGETPAPRTAEYYRELAPKVKAAYTREFWDDKAGRFIGCVDIDGKRHDYGFTFVNLEAMAYGLASEAQAKRIYDWMEHGVTSGGKADTYTRWVFAPRANTIHNPMWDEKGVNDPNANGVEPWWQEGWRGTPYSDVQCQDGGAILYTSYYDLLARSRLLSPDNAWQRWTEILGRYRNPDRLCGGPPLFRGEIPQQANPGAVGLDIPFPESGIVPIWFLHGLAGVQPSPEGLVIAPRLPKALPWLAVRNLCYRNLVCDLRVTNTSVELSSKQKGFEFTWRRSIAPGGQVVLRDPPPPLRAFPEATKPPVSTSSWRAHWLWAAGDPDKTLRVFLRKTFTLDAVPASAPLVATGDNAFKLYVNGQVAVSGDDWNGLFRADIAKLLQKGKNVIAIEGVNVDGPAGVIMECRLGAAKGAPRLFTDATWRVSVAAPEAWQSAAFDDAGWKPAADVGQAPCAPWDSIGAPGL